MRRKFLILQYKVLDLATFCTGFFLALWVVSGGDFAALDRLLAPTPPKVVNLVLFLTILAIWHFMFVFFNLYMSRRMSTLRSEVRDIVKATTLGAFALSLVVSSVYPALSATRFLPYFWAIVNGLTVASRALMRLFLKQVRKRGRNLRHVLIVGTNRRAVSFSKRLSSRPELGYNVIGFMDRHWTGIDETKRVLPTPILDLSRFAGFIRENVVDEVVVFLPMKTFYRELFEIISLCQEQGIIVRFNSEIFDLKVGKFRPEIFEDMSVVTVYTGPYDNWQYLAKRFVDVTASAGLLILLLPVMVAIAVLIKSTSLGPVFFVQKRLGYNKRVFRMIKFRTMVADAEERVDRLEEFNESDGPTFKIRDDPRITPVGRYLRKTSIDELPQLLNVFIGDMSLVGPRPLPIRDYRGFDTDWHRRRFSVPPGVTGLWQVSGRSKMSFERWMKLDMEYIDRWSLWLDLKILLKTVPAVIRGAGAM